MILAAKRFAKKATYITTGIISVLLAIFLFYGAFTAKHANYGVERLERKNGMIWGLVTLMLGIGAVGYGLTGIKSYDKDTVKLTGQSSNNKPEALAEIENFKIKSFSLPGMEGNYLEAHITYKGEDREISIFFADESEIQNISRSEKLKVIGELQRDAFISIHNAKIIGRG